MMEYLHLFSDSSSHDAVYNGDSYNEPWVAYIEDDELVTYNKPHDYSKDYFTIEALETGNVYFKYVDEASIEIQRYMEYSKDGGETWVRTTNVDNEELVMQIPLNKGEKVCFRGDNDSLGSDDSTTISHFYSNIKTNVFGNIMSLCYANNFSDKVTLSEDNEFMFSLLFAYTDYNTHIVSAENLILPATTLADYCYQYMFQNCTSLTTAPELPATTLANYCYHQMFSSCTSLNYIKAMFTTKPSTTYTNNWVSGVAASGTFVKNSAATWTTTGVNGIPTGWTVETASA